MKDRISIQQVDNGWVINLNEYALGQGLQIESYVARSNIEAIQIVSRLILSNKLPIEESVD